MDVGVAARYGRTMKFDVDKLYLAGAHDEPNWTSVLAPQPCCEADGADAGAVLTTVVAAEGGTQLGECLSFTNGQAVTLARKGEIVYALRAVPRRATQP